MAFKKIELNHFINRDKTSNKLDSKEDNFFDLYQYIQLKKIDS